MHNFMKAKDPIQNESTFDKGRLERTNGAMSNGGKTRVNPLAGSLAKLLIRAIG